MDTFFLWVLGVFVALVVVTLIGAAFSARPKRPDYVDPEDRPLYDDPPDAQG